MLRPTLREVFDNTQSFYAEGIFTTKERTLFVSAKIQWCVESTVRFYEDVDFKKPVENQDVGDYELHWLTGFDDPHFVCLGRTYRLNVPDSDDTTKQVMLVMREKTQETKQQAWRATV